MREIRIHRGEILQIHKMITKFNQTGGNLHGLFSESKQPVVLIAFGGEESKRKYCEEKLAEAHGLRKLGEWFVEISTRKVPSGEVSLVFNESGHLVRHTVDNISAICDIIDGQSAFRLDASVTDMLKTQTGLESSEMLMTTQWYFTEEGSTILGEILTQLPVHGLETPQMSRNKTTQDFTILVHVNQEPIEIQFPNNFPTTEPEIIYRHKKEKLQMTAEGTKDQKVQIAELLCSAVFDFISSSNEPTASQSDLGKVNEIKEHNLNKSANDIKQERSQATQRNHPEKDENCNEKIEDGSKKEQHQVAGTANESNQPQKKPLNDIKDQSQDRREDGPLSGESKIPRETNNENSDVKREKEVSSEFQKAMDCKDCESHSETSHAPPPGNEPENKCEEGIQIADTNESRMDVDENQRTCDSENEQMDTSL